MKKMRVIATWILFGIHLIAFIIARINLVGHPYGEPDKYGDYARGFYDSEVSAASTCLIIMWTIVAILAIIKVISMIKNEDEDNLSGKSDSGFVWKILDFIIEHPTVVVFLGTLITQIKYSSLH